MCCNILFICVCVKKAGINDYKKKGIGKNNIKNLGSKKGFFVGVYLRRYYMATKKKLNLFFCFTRSA